MRSDMAKIIVERPRIKPWGAEKGKTKKVDLEDMPQHESMKKKYRHDIKQLNENLAPLRRYLNSKVGQPWDVVYSEICEHIKLNSAVQRHILEHLFSMIDTNTYIGDDGHIYVRSGMGDFRVDEHYSSYRTLYVDPKTKTIKRVPKKDYPKYPQEIIRIDVSDKIQYHKINSIWYEAKIEKYKSEKVTRQQKIEYSKIVLFREEKIIPHPYYMRYDVILKEVIGLVGVNVLQRTYGKSGVYASSIKQLNSKELRKAKLKND